MGGNEKTGDRFGTTEKGTFLAFIIISVTFYWFYFTLNTHTHTHAWFCVDQSVLCLFLTALVPLYFILADALKHRTHAEQTNPASPSASTMTNFWVCSSL